MRFISALRVFQRARAFWKLEHLHKECFRIQLSVTGVLDRCSVWREDRNSRTNEQQPRLLVYKCIERRLNKSPIVNAALCSRYPKCTVSVACHLNSLLWSLMKMLRSTPEPRESFAEELRYSALNEAGFFSMRSTLLFIQMAERSPYFNFFLSGSVIALKPLTFGFLKQRRDLLQNGRV